MEKPNRSRREMLVLTGTVTLAGIGLGSGGHVLAQESGTDSEQERTIEWDGKKGSDLAEQDCETTQQGFWHWILTTSGPPSLVEAGAELTVEFDDGTTKAVDGYRPGGGGGALHFDMTKDGGGTVETATVTFSGGGDNTRLTISNGECQEMSGEDDNTSDGTDDTPEEPSEEFEDLTVTQECVNGNGTITVSNSNDVSAPVTVLGPNGYEQEKEVPAGGAVEFSGLENGSYDLETAADDIGLDHSSVDIDY